MSKYHNTKMQIDGITFASKAEARRYAALVVLQRAGHIDHLTIQPKFEVVPSFVHNGKNVRGIVYIADFSYIDRDTGRTVVEDVKGLATEAFKIKAKLFRYRFPELDFRVMTARDIGG